MIQLKIIFSYYQHKGGNTFKIPRVVMRLVRHPKPMNIRSHPANLNAQVVIVLVACSLSKISCKYLIIKPPLYITEHTNICFMNVLETCFINNL